MLEKSNMREEATIRHTHVKESVQDILQYFSIFQFPLFVWEIHKYMNYACTKEELKTVLDDLTSAGHVYCFDECYSTVNEADWAVKKKEGYQRALTRLKQAGKNARFIAKFPFVKMVAVSGSLSKYSSKPDGDIDYFIVTAKNRLWITRTLLHLFKKLTFLVGKQHDFCMNYFVDTSDLMIEEQNKFTAIEITSLICKYGHDVFTTFLKQNKWVEQFVPNAELKTEDIIPESVSTPNTILDSLNIKLMNLTDRKWKAKWKRKGYDMSQYTLAFKTSVSVSKNHPKNYQKRVLDTYESKKK